MFRCLWHTLANYIERQTEVRTGSSKGADPEEPKLAKELEFPSLTVLMLTDYSRHRIFCNVLFAVFTMHIHKCGVVSMHETVKKLFLHPVGEHYMMQAQGT